MTPPSKRAAAKRLAALVLVAVMSACGDASDSESEPAPPGTHYAEIDRDVFTPTCALPCHSGGQFAAGGLDMKTSSYQTLLSSPITDDLCTPAGLARVVPGKPDESLLYLKITTKIAGVEAPCGDGMPAGVDRPPLSDADADRIRQWIERGAPDD